MNVDGRVVAIVGPNEAGKTSLLRGLLHLNASGDFAADERTRGSEVPDGPVLWARYLLGEEDLQALAHLPGAKQAKWFIANKYANGEVIGHIEPSTITRDLGPRRRIVKLLRRAAAHRAMEGVAPIEGNPPLADALSGLADELHTDQETLQSDGMIRAVAHRIRAEETEDFPKYVKDLPDRLELLADNESAPRPHQEAVKILYGLQPEFFLFSEAERSLQSDYDLNVHAEDPPVALRNLAQLAKLDLIAMRDAVQAEDFGRAEHLEEQANERLEQAFDEAWRQSGVSPRLRLEGPLLRILVSASAGGYTSYAERSDGLRWFIALLTYTTLNPREVRPVLLVDEAESHLHYDAQADLVRVFSQQETVAKIIYTTHSAGCLPEDLGTGVRVVVPSEDGTSEIQNQFWTGGPGFSPLLTAMGANVLAFTPSRYAVIAEGASEVILLPTLLREATDKDVLPFQVAPGLAELAPSAVDSLDLEAARIAYFLDGDRAGREIKKKLKKGGVPEDLIVSLGGKSSELVLEDLLEVQVLVTALNEELERSYGLGDELSASDLPARGRPAAVKAWCEKRGVNAPSKTALAYRLLELRSDGIPLLAPNRKETLSQAHEGLRQALGLDSD